MRLIVFLLITTSSLTVYGQSDEAQIRALAKQFSENLVAGKLDLVVEAYTNDAKIFPHNHDILEGEALAQYWNPQDPTDWKITYHKITPVEIKVLGKEAYDYGYYEGTSANGEESLDWKGKYVIIWKRVDDEWKIYLDIWNSIPTKD